MSQVLDELRARTVDLAGVLGVSVDQLPTFGFAEQTARPYIDESDGELVYGAFERGSEMFRRTTVEADDILYWTFEGITFWMASKYEVQHRVEGQDVRVILYTKQRELLDSLSARWGERMWSEKAAYRRDAGLV